MKKIIFLLLFVFACNSEDVKKISGYDTDYKFAETNENIEQDITVSSDIKEIKSEIAEETTTQDFMEQNDSKDAVEQSEIAESFISEVTETVKPDDVSEIVENKVSKDIINKICGDYCMKLKSCCEEGIEKEECKNYDPASCILDCVDTTSKENEKLSYYICESIKDCNSDIVCKKQYEEKDECTNFCKKLEGCPGIDFVFFQTESEYECELMCTGLYNGTKKPDGGSYVEPIFDCVEAALNNNCDSMQALDCYKEIICQDLCDKLEQCKKVDELYNNIENCNKVCINQNTGSTIAESLCIELSGCENANICIDPPEEPIEQTKEICEQLMNSCKDSDIFENMPDDELLCQWYFTGLSMTNDKIDFSKTDDCGSLLDDCQINQFFGCLLGFIPTCSDICDILSQKCPNGNFDCEKDFCKQYSNMQLLAEQVCFSFNTCLVIQECAQIPDTPDEDVVKLCEELKDKCVDQKLPENIGWVQDTVSCNWIVTGIKTGIKPSAFDTMSKCLSEIQECSEDFISKCLPFRF